MISILLIIIGIGALIFVHELGHFTVAKLSGVKVDVFSIGFGWKFLKTTYGETEYALSIIPLGGYVKMAGELPGESRSLRDEEEMPEQVQSELPELKEALQEVDYPGNHQLEGDLRQQLLDEGFSEETIARYNQEVEKQRELHSKSAWKRFWIFSAGSLMNLLVAFPLCIAMYWIGVDVPGNRIGNVRGGSPEWTAGVEPGDELIAIQVQQTPGPVQDNGEWGPKQRVDTLSVYREVLIGLSENQHVKLHLQDPEKNSVRTVVIDPDDIMDQQGIAPYGNKVRQVVEDSPADRAGLKRGDQILEVNGYRIRSFQDLRNAVDAYVNPPITYLVRTKEGGLDIRELTIPRGTTYLVSYQSMVAPVYQLSEDLNLSEDLPLRDGEQIVRVNEHRITAGKDGSIEVEPDDIARNFTYHRAMSGPLEIVVKRDDKRKTFSLFPEIQYHPKAYADHFMRPDIKKVRAGSPADRAGIKEGDLVLAVNGQPVPNFSYFRTWINFFAGEEITLTVKREGQEQEVTVKPEKDQFGDGRIGVIGDQEVRPFPSIPEHTELAKAGFQEGDRLIAFYNRNGKKKELEGSLKKFLKFLDTRPETISVVVKREEEEKEITFQAEKTTYGLIGVAPGPVTFEKKYQFMKGIRKGLVEGVSMFRVLVLGLKKMASKPEQAKEGISGPVRIAAFSYRAVQQGVGKFLELLALISISLGVFNLFPLPPLDGGHILFLAIEKVRGKPLGEDTLYLIQMLGFLFLLVLIILVTYNDILHIMGG